MQAKPILYPIIKIGNKAAKKVSWFLYYSEEPSSGPFLFFRIAIGLLVLLHFVTTIGDLHLLFGPGGMLPAEITDMYVDPLVLTRNKLMQGLSPGTFDIWFNTVYILFSCFLIAGFLTRVSAFVMLLLHTVLIKSNVFVSYGVDFFTSISLFYLISFPVDRKFSIDSFLFKRNSIAPESFLFYRRFLQLHICLAYFFSGLNKVAGYNWRNGESIWKTLNLPYANIDFRLKLEWLSNYPVILTIIGWSVIILELFYPVIFYKKIRKYWLYAVIGMHVGIAIVLNLYFFSAIMIIWNITSFMAFEKPLTQQRCLCQNNKKSYRCRV